MLIMTWCSIVIMKILKKHNVISATNIVKIEITVIQQLPLKTTNSHMYPCIASHCLTGAHFL